MVIFIFIFLLLVLGVIIIWYLEKCPHEWEYFDTYTYKDIQTGATKRIEYIYRCKYCKKHKVER